MCHRQTVGCGSPGAYRVHSAFAGGPTSAHSAVYGSANSGIGHVRTAPSVSAVARSLPSGLNATPDTLPPEPAPARRGAPTACPVAGFHSRTEPSLEAVASSLPSGLNATPFTPPLVAAGRGAPTAWPVAGFHSRTVPSPSALASSLPSGLNATPFTLPKGSAGRGAPTAWPV